jgi:toxin YoeB
VSKTLSFLLSAWHEYCHWQTIDKKQVKRINDLLKDIERNGNEGIGKPEALKHEWSGYWSRRIDERHRLVYRIVDDTIEVLQCGEHYGE